MLLGAGLIALLVLLVHPGAGQANGAKHRWQPSASVSGEFGVFGRAARRSDALPARAAYAAGSVAIVAGGITRRIGPVGGAVAEWGSAKGDELCITVGASAGVASGGPAACNRLATLSQPNELLVMAAGSGGGADKPGKPPPPSQVVAGLAPNGVSSVTINFTNGTSTAVAVANNGFVLNTDGRTPGTYTWVANGAQNTE